jgi:membrane-associated phospholipid phosphatase
LSKRRELLLLLALAAASFVLAWVFARVASEMLEGELLRIDGSVQGWITRYRSPAGKAVFGVITQLGAKEVLAPLAALIAWRLFRETRTILALMAFAAIAAGEFVAVLKRDFHVLRPAGGLSEGLGFSFPSGHSTGSAAIAVLLTYVAIRRRIHPLVVGSVSVLVVLLVGLSRVYLDVHWASDVLGGWAIGGAFGVGCCALYEVVRRRAETHAAASSGAVATARRPEA